MKDKSYYIGDGTIETGSKIIAKLESLGGENKYNHDGTLINVAYYIRDDNKIISDDDINSLIVINFTEAFLDEKVEPILTADEILIKMKAEMPFSLSKKIIPYIKEAMEIYAQQFKK
jgi:hypothetical protein